MHNQDLGRVAVVARGAYDPSAEYERLDAVSYNGSSYLVRKHCQGVEPTEGEYYMLMAQAGDSTAANAAAEKAIAAAERADSASGRADTAAGNADNMAASAGAAAEAANAAAAAAQDVVDSVQPDIAQVKQGLAAHGEALDNRIKKFYTGNLGAVNIADSDDGAVRNLVIGGRSEQDRTDGINMYNYTDTGIVKTSNGITFTSVENGGISVVGTSVSNANTSGVITPYLDKLTDGKTYICKTFNNNVKAIFNLTMADGSSKFTDILEYNQATITSVYPYFQVKSGVTINAIVYPMVCEEAYADHPYEPYTGGAPSPSPDYPQEIKSVENCAMTVSNADGTETQTAPIPVTLRGIGDVRDELYGYADGTGKLVQRITCEKPIKTDIKPDRESDVAISVMLVGALSQNSIQNAIRSNRFIQGNTLTPYKIACYNNVVYASFPKDKYPTYDDAANYVRNLDFYVMYKHNPIVTALTAEQVKALFDLRTYYGGTNISYQSENGVEPVVNFDYACALENFVEYIKAAQGDDRKFIYDMDERMTDAEYVAALAYVNSEYATALTELEV